MDLWLAPQHPPGPWPRLMMRYGFLGEDEADAPALEVFTGSAYGVRGHYRKLVAGYQRDGWTCADTALDGLDEPIDDALEAALQANPGDVEVALVYADWLVEQAHPRGELILIQRARAHRPDDPALAKREATLLRDHASSLLPFHVEHAALDWDVGFIRAARLSGDECEGMLWELLHHPSGRFLRDLAIETTTSEEAFEILCRGERPHPSSESARGFAARPPPIRRLVIVDRGLGHEAIDARDLLPTYRWLEELVIEGSPVMLDRAALPRLVRLALRLRFIPVHPSSGTLAGLRFADMPQLAELELGFGDDGDPWRDPDAELRALVQILARTELPRLRTLRLAGPPLPTELCPRLVRSPLVHALDHLDLGETELAPEAVDALIAGAAALAGLRTLAISGDRVMPGDRGRLRDAFGERLIAAEGFPDPGHPRQ
ncbi:MAG: TIGR02996 domain-containing protein [Deltaproteobacteria bacterium]|nr:TIGR02996 domain-containing protein [Deltaproteobacteria bacterium]MDQ3295191.1 TIGR02996 domain-containing protein [Myxococcota bacterium]